MRKLRCLLPITIGVLAGELEQLVGTNELLAQDYGVGLRYAATGRAS